jgi:hypothetical protein
MKKNAIAAAIVALICLSWLIGIKLADFTPQAPIAKAEAKPAAPPSTRPVEKLPPPTIAKTGDSPSEPSVSQVVQGDAIAEKAEIERCKKIDIDHMKQLHKGILAFVKKYRHYPEQLSQLVPEFVSADVLRSPRKKTNQSNSAFAMEHADPGIDKPSYAFEFSNIEYRDGRTFAEIKEVQRTEWGDVVPMLRSFAYDKVINISCRGDVYETRLNWEWDSATLDLAEKYGWGPGLNVGDMVKVQVLRPDGSPATGAQVWADGRNYSFDLPNRPFTADSDGWATIPVGADTDRTALVLRAEMPGYSSSIDRSERGNLPEGKSLTLAPSQRIGGTAVSADGKPMSGARVFLQQTPAPEAADARPRPPVMSVVTDAQGRWTAEVHPDEVAGLSVRLGEPGGTPFKHAPLGTPLDVSAAKAGKAVIRK